MFKKSLHLFALAIVIGFFAGCSSSSPFVDGIQEQLKLENYQKALEQAETAIKEYPQDPLAYYYKGVVLGQLAQTHEPGNREQYYKQMEDAFAKSQEIARQNEGDIPEELQNLDAVKTTLWRNEHNRAIELVTDDSLRNAVQNNVQKSVYHLQNATFLQPDSTLSWTILAQVHWMNNDPDNAINAYETARDKSDSLSKNDYLRLADYYRVTEQPAQSLDVLQEAQQFFPATIQIKEKMADAYMQLGQRQKAFDILKTLVKENPENPRYYLVLGTQYYQTALNLSDSLNSNGDQITKLNSKLENAQGEEAQQVEEKISSLQQSNKQLQERIDELTQLAINQLTQSLNYEYEDQAAKARAFNSLGIIYQNRAYEWYNIRNQTTDNQEAAKYDKRGDDNLREAMGYYEKAVEIEPNNKEYWKSLYQIYVTLGMDEKAKEAEKKAGMN